MNNKPTLRVKNALKTSLRRRLLVGTAGMLVIAVVGGLIYFNLFASKKSIASENAQQPLQLIAICSPNPSLEKHWKIVNNNTESIAVSWDVYPNFVTGLIVANPGETTFTTPTLPGPNSVRIRWQTDEGNNETDEGDYNDDDVDDDNNGSNDDNNGINDDNNGNNDDNNGNNDDNNENGNDDDDNEGNGNNNDDDEDDNDENEGNGNGSNLVWHEVITVASNETCALSGCYVTEVVSYTPTKRNDGQPVAAERRVTSRALGAPQNDNTLNFVALGFGGEIVLKFASPIANGNGDDIKVTETTFGNRTCARYPEKIEAYASQDGCNYIYLGTGCQDAFFDLGVMSWAQYIKIRDISDVTHSFYNEIADGYDIDGVECLNGAAANPGNDGLVAGSAQDVIEYNQGTRKNGTPIHSTRINAESALGIPQNNDIGVNFVSLGFTGSLVLKFDFVIFNKPGNDLKAIETSFGAPSCQAYPEAAMFEGSLDGITYFPMGEVCQDGEMNLEDGVYAIQYLRITDRSPASSFPNSADGYDLDGVIVLSTECGQQTRIRAFDNVSTPDEVALMSISPNPFKDVFAVNYESGSVDEKVNMSVFNSVGQRVFKEQFTVPSNTKYTHDVSGVAFPKGIYIVTVESAGQKQSSKIIKN